MKLSELSVNDQMKLVNNMPKLMLKQFVSLYPLVTYDTFCDQVTDGRVAFNPFKRYGLVWFHMPSVLLTLKNINYPLYGNITSHHPFFKQLQKKTLNVKQLKTIQVRGIRERELEIDGEDEQEQSA